MASPGDLLELKNLRTTPHTPTGSESEFQQNPGVTGTLQFEKHWSIRYGRMCGDSLRGKKEMSRVKGCMRGGSFQVQP